MDRLLGVLEIIGGVMLIISAIIIIAAVTMQEGKSATAALSGASEDFTRGRSKTANLMLKKVTQVVGIAFVVLSIAVNLISIFVK